MLLAVTTSTAYSTVGGSALPARLKARAAVTATESSQAIKAELIKLGATSGRGAWAVEPVRKRAATLVEQLEQPQDVSPHCTNPNAPP